jgi:hypothetical protein
VQEVGRDDYLARLPALLDVPLPARWRTGPAQEG